MRTVVYEYVVTAVFNGEPASYRRMADLIEWIEDSFGMGMLTSNRTVVVTMTEHVGTSELVDELMENYLDQILSFEVKRQVQRA